MRQLKVTAVFARRQHDEARQADDRLRAANAEQIWYRALDVYFTSTTRYVNTSSPANTSRAHTLSAATDLFGVCSTEYKAVQAAWTAVNVGGNDESCPAGNDLSLAAPPNSGSTNPGGSVTSTITAT